MRGEKSKQRKNPQRHRQQYGDYQREREVGEVEEGIGGKMVMEVDLTWGCEHTVQYTDDVL